MAVAFFVGELRMSLYDGTESPYRGKDPGMELLADFSYTDCNGVTWTAHQFDIVDGASIPWFGQPLVGTPYNRSYLGPSVLHDVYCRDGQRSKRETDRMFYEAMLTNEVPQWKAYAMWLAVSLFGPRW